MGHLYCLEQFSFTSVFLEYFNDSYILHQCIKNSFVHQSISFPQGYTMTSNNDMHLWHSRLGHPSDQVLNHFPFSFDKKSADNACDTCPLAKQTRKPFPIL